MFDGEDKKGESSSVLKGDGGRLARFCIMETLHARTSATRGLQLLEPAHALLGLAAGLLQPSLVQFVRDIIHRLDALFGPPGYETLSLL